MLQSGIRRPSLDLRTSAVYNCQPASRQKTVLARPSIVFQHPEILAINKPPGLPFHSNDAAVGVIPTLRGMEADGLLPELGPLYPLHRSLSRPIGLDAALLC